MPAVRLNSLTRAIWRVHRWVFRATGGRIGTRLAGHDVLFLTTTGRVSGRQRTVGLNYRDTESGPAVIGSYAGEDRDPAWAWNLRAEPSATIRLGTVEQRVRARETADAEHAGLLRRFVEKDRAYRVYHERTDRLLPIFILEPQE